MTVGEILITAAIDLHRGTGPKCHTNQIRIFSINLPTQFSALRDKYITYILQRLRFATDITWEIHSYRKIGKTRFFQHFQIVRFRLDFTAFHAERRIFLYIIKGIGIMRGIYLGHSIRILIYLYKYLCRQYRPIDLNIKCVIFKLYDRRRFIFNFKMEWSRFFKFFIVADDAS